ncbi:hypothetical protein [Collimonas arenae]|uniref:hypothetical protein n=1 Tax=Collimonas arenae TaxID=279058 RepID=UPI0012DFF16C|nr:hypothetical protein [Collimonas arenae]
MVALAVQLLRDMVGNGRYWLAVGRSQTTAIIMILIFIVNIKIHHVVFARGQLTICNTPARQHGHIANTGCNPYDLI